MRDPQISGANGGGKRRRHTLVPDYMFEKFDDIGVDFLKNIGVRSLVIDIDNTLAPYEVAEPSAGSRRSVRRGYARRSCPTMGASGSSATTAVSGCLRITTAASRPANIS